MRSLGLRIFLLITLVACLLTLLPSCGHTHTPGEWITDNEATCTENGARHTECTSCGETVSNETIPAKGHSYEEGACTVCGFADPEYVKPDAPVCQHELVRHEAKAPTCNDAGWDAYESCSKCDYTTYSEKAALGHDEMAHDAKAPTCNEIGWDAYVTCSRCDYTTYAEIAALGHSSVVKPGYSATCTENGVTDSTVCSTCSEVLTAGSIIPATGHSYDGEADADCNVCGAIRDVNCKHTKTETIPGYAATCNEQGLTDGTKCIDCGEITAKQEIIGALGHDEIAHSAKAPTCNDAGWDAYVTCSRCDYTTYSEKAALGHDEIAHSAKAPTCNDAGWDSYVTCSRCDYTTYNEKAALGHDYVDGACVNCGELKPSEGLEYTTNADGKTCYVSDIGTCSDTNIIIPSISPKGYTVTGIGEAAFRYRSHITGITVPNSVTSIGNSAFEGCTALTKVTIGNGVMSIGDRAFYYCSGLISITVPDTVKSIGEHAFALCSGLTATTISDGVTSIGNSAFEGCTALTKVTIGNGVMSIGDRAFNNCTSLAGVTIPDSVKSIGQHTFAHCAGLTAVALSDSVTSIGNNAFLACTALESITIPSNITRIEFSTFSDCEKLTSIVIPNSVTDIGSSAFLRCTSLTSVTIGSNVESIGDGAFSLCTGLTSITIPDSVKSIADNAFSSCTGLTSIIIPDSVISIGSSAFCGCTGFKSVTIGINVTTIGDNAFFGCTGLTSITIPDKVQSIGRLAFRECTGLTSIAIPDSVTSIGETAFASCSGLTSVVIGSGVTTIGWGAFLECSAITEVIYHGTPDEYASISIAEYNDALTSITPIYSHTCTPGEAVKEKVIEATCTAGGSYELVVYCTACGTELSRESVSVDALGHSYVGGTCSRCGALEPNNDLIFVPIDGTTCYVSGTRGDEPTLVIPSFAPDGKKVVKIGNGAFSGDWNITYVILPDTLTSIGDNAFNGCDYLCEISIPAGVTEIGEYAFSGCNMSEITIPSGVKEISKGTFSGCISLEVLHIGSGVTKIGDYAFRGCDRLRNTVIPEGVKEIGENAFNYCDDMTEIVIPSSVTYIGRGAFTNCYFLRSITVPFVGEYMDGSGQTFFAHIFGAQDHTEAGSYLPDSLKSVTVTGGTVIEACAFMECDRINSITLPDTLTTIGDKAFDGCYSLTSIVIPVGVTEIMGQIFSGCTALTDIKVADGNANYRSVDGSLYSKDGIALITYAPGKTETTFTVPDGVELIIDSAFANCEYITRITFPVSLREIGSAAFLDCSSLRIIDLEEGVTAIGDSAFKGCSLVIVNYNGKRESFDNITGATEAFAGVELVIPHRCEPGQPVIENEIFADCNNAGSYELVTYCADPDCPNGRPEMSRETKSTPALGHSYVGIKCSRCGDSLESEGLVFTSNGDGTCSLGGMGTCVDTEVIIPMHSPIGDKVTSIGPGAFANQAGITRVIIPEGVTSIADDTSFAGCTGLTYVSIPDSIESLPRLPFKDSNKLGYTQTGGALYLGNENNRFAALIRATSIYITSCVIDSSTKCIADYAFYNCQSMTELEIGKSVEHIGAYSFSECRGITSLTMPSTLKTIGSNAFAFCTSISSIGIPDGVAHIGDGAFSYCGAAGSVTIPASVKSIGENAFRNCQSVNSLYIADLESWLNIVFANDYSNPIAYSTRAKTLYIGGNKITEIVIPDGVKAIPAYAFCGVGITSASLPESVTDIGSYAFYCCADLKSINLPHNISAINEYTFRKCAALAQIEIPAGVTNIAEHAFDACTSLTSIVIPESVTSIGMSAFLGCTGLKSAVITGAAPTSAEKTIIGHSAFSDCTALSDVTIGDGVSELIGSTFSNCTSLTSIRIGKGVTNIGSYSFYMCSALRSITLYEALSSIGACVFDGCGALIEIRYYGDADGFAAINVESIGNDAFTKISPTYVHDCIEGKAVKEKVIEATCTTGGSYDLVVYCTVRGEELSRESVSMDALGHSFVGAKCERCGELKVSEGLSYQYNKNYMVCYVTGRGSCKDEDIVIPSMTPDGYTVVEIMSDAFIGDCTLKSITIPSTVTRIGWNSFENCEELKTVVFSDGLDEIGQYAFKNCYALESINIPKSVTSVDIGAFESCDSLSGVYIDDIASWCNIYWGDSYFGYYRDANPLMHAKKLYVNGERVTNIVIPEGVTSIPDLAFIGCNLTSVTIPQSVTSIGKCAFSECYNLVEVINYSSLDIIAGESTHGEISYHALEVHGGKSKLEQRGDFIFYPYDGMNYLVCCLAGNNDIVLPTSFDGEKYAIADYAFYGSKLTSVEFSDNLIGIGDYAFSNCRSLTELVIPNSIESIGFGAFYECNMLSSISLPFVGSDAAGTVASHIGYAFGGETSSKNYYVPDSLKTVAITGGVSIGGFRGCDSITTVIIAVSGTASIPNFAFGECSALTTVTLSGNIESIGNSAFEKCVALKEAIIPDSVKTLGYGVFSECSSITSIVIGSGVTDIGHSMAYNCNKLSTVTFSNTEGWWCATSSSATSGTEITPEEIKSPSTMANYFKTTYRAYYWHRTVKAAPVYTREEGYIYFGEYPQTIKADDVTITDTQDERGYYLGSDNCYYAKVVSAPNSAAYTFSSGKSIEYDTVYYFKVEPIRWKILTESDGKAFLLCDSIIDNKAFDGTSESHSNNYAESDIRAWLNNEFYNTAFSELQREIILTTTVDNSLESTENSSNSYVCDDTEDKVFLLSCADVMNFNYGFSDLYTSSDYTRTRKSSDYARANGVWMSTYSGSYKGNGCWWLRSPFYYDDKYVYQVDGEGKFYESRRAAYATVCGVVPAIWITL